MTPIDSLKPWRITVSLIPCVYAALLILELKNTKQKLLLVALAMVALLWFISSIGYPILLCLPAFSGMFLLAACIFALYEGLPDYSLLPATRSFAELWAMVMLALGYIGWGTMTARRAVYSF